MGVLYVPFISCKIFINATKISGGIMKVYSRRFVIDVYDDNLHLNHLLYWDKPVKEFFESYQVEIRELEENETITKE
jgi:hypothetical protein